MKARRSLPVPPPIAHGGADTRATRVVDRSSRHVGRGNPFAAVALSLTMAGCGPSAPPSTGNSVAHGENPDPSRAIVGPWRTHELSEPQLLSLTLASDGAAAFLQVANLDVVDLYELRDGVAADLQHLAGAGRGACSAGGVVATASGATAVTLHFVDGAEGLHLHSRGAVTGPFGDTRVDDVCKPFEAGAQAWMISATEDKAKLLVDCGGEFAIADTTAGVVSSRVELGRRALDHSWQLEDSAGRIHLVPQWYGDGRYRIVVDGTIREEALDFLEAGERIAGAAACHGAIYLLIAAPPPGGTETVGPSDSGALSLLRREGSRWMREAVAIVAQGSPGPLAFDPDCAPFIARGPRVFARDPDGTWRGTEPLEGVGAGFGPLAVTRSAIYTAHRGGPGPSWWASASLGPQ
jgi:hypothetical protein